MHRTAEGLPVIREGKDELKEMKERRPTAELLRALTPENFVDASGIERTVYTFKNKRGKPVRVVFYGREEFPAAPSADRPGPTFLFGDKPRWRKEEDWNRFCSDLQNHAKATEAVNPLFVHGDIVDSGESFFFVEQSPRALLDMAFILGVEQSELRESRLLASQEKVDDKLEKMVDRVIAGKMLNDQGEFKETADAEGEALLMLALTGNRKAAGVLENKRLLLLEKDRERDARQMAENKENLEKESEKALRPEELVAVHMTKYKPRPSEERDAWELQTTYEATGKQIPRITQHFTMNHPVVSAGLYGSWEDAPIAVLMPFDRMMKKNGKPAVLNTVDTFWEVSPGRRTVLPKKDTYLIEPGSVKGAGKLFEASGQTITYKSSNIKPEDISALTDGLDEYERNALENHFREAFAKTFYFYNYETANRELLIPEEDFYRLTKVFGAQRRESPSIAFTYGMEKPRKFLPEFQKHTIKRVIEQILEEAQISHAVGQETVLRLVKEMETYFVFQIKKWVIENTIRKMGYEVHGGGMWAWDGDSWAATAQTRKLGAELGVWVGPHSGHESHKVEEWLMRGLGKLQSGEKSIAEHHLSMKNAATPDWIAKLSPPMRRMLYETGVLL